MPSVTSDTDLSPATRVTNRVLVGSGFLALDLLYRNAGRTPTRRYAGGSFGNVMAILAFLGWKSYPVARLGTDPHAKTLLEDLKGFRVDTKFVCQARTGTTPIMVVRVVKNVDGGFRSRFEWRHPNSGDRLPGYRPLPKFVASEVSPRLPKARVFYFDRAEPSSLLLATTMRERGALVYFEPSSCKDERLFTACMAVSDIVKYSAERISQPPCNPNTPSPRLEIQTLGSNGLRYRLKNGAATPGPWRMLPAQPVAAYKDSTGCGDWTSAGLLHQVGLNGRKGFLRLSEGSIFKALSFGQALAAVNAEFEGARGPMYALSAKALLARVSDMQAAVA